MRRLQFLASFRWKLCLALMIVIMGDQLFYQHQLYGGYVGLFAFSVLSCLILGRSNVRHRRAPRIAAVFAFIFACALVIDPGLLAWTLFWTAISIATLLGMTTPFDDGWLWFQRLVLHGLRAPVAPLIDLAKVHRATRRPRIRRFSVRAIITLVALPFVGSAIIIALFASANPVIAEILSAIELPDLSGVTPMRLMFWAAFLVLGWSVMRPRIPQYLIPTFDGSGDLPLPGVSVASVTLSLILFNALFVIENLLDAAYLSRALPLPQGMSITEYVHRGAYPLIGTALLAGLFVLITLRPGSTTASVPAIRRLVILWIIQNVILVASSVQRTLEYIEISMLTTLRIHALAWMGLVATGLILICWRMLREKSASWLINANLAAATAVLMTFCFVDAGAVAAWWNVRHAHEVTGSGRNLDLCYLGQLGPSALLPLIELEGQPIAPSFRERVHAVRSGIQQEMTYAIAHGGSTWRNERRLAAADERLRLLQPVAMRPGPRNCDGSLQLKSAGNDPESSSMFATLSDPRAPLTEEHEQ